MTDERVVKMQGKHPVRVLIADNEQAVRYSLQLAFGIDPDIEVIGEAANGQEAVRLAAKTRPDVVLMDCHMPIMDGLEATRLIKSNQPEVKVIVLTASSAYRDQARAAGADVFILKDLSSLDELCEAIQLEARNTGRRDRNTTLSK